MVKVKCPECGADVIPVKQGDAWVVSCKAHNCVNPLQIAWLGTEEEAANLWHDVSKEHLELLCKAIDDILGDTLRTTKTSSVNLLCKQ